MSTDTYARTFAPAHIVRARTVHVTADTMATLDVDDMIINAGDAEMIPTGERHTIVDIRGGWLTVARQEWHGNTYGGEWATVVEHKRRRRDLVGARRVTDAGMWLRPEWAPSVSYVASLPGSLVVVVVESADATPHDLDCGHASRAEAERYGIVVEWQGTATLNGRVHAFAAPAHLVERLREITGWFAERGAILADMGGECTGHESHSRRPDECRKCGRTVGEHNRAPVATRPPVLDRAGQPINPGDLVKRVVIVAAGTGTQHIGEHGTVIYASDPTGRGVLVMWERTDAGKPCNSYAGHVVVVDQVPDVEPTPAAAPVASDQDAPAAPAASDDQDNTDALPVTTADQPGPGFWTCCVARPGAVIVMDTDGGERDAFRVACASDAATYARINGADRVMPLPAGYVTPVDAPAARTMLADDQRTADAQREAGTYVWGDRPLPAAPLVHTPDVDDDAEAAYGYTQCSDDMRDGDLVDMPALSLVAVLVKAWPCAVTASNGEGVFHRYVTGGSPEDDARYADRFATARAYATAHGYPLHSDGGEGGSDQPTDGPAPTGTDTDVPADDDQVPADTAPRGWDSIGPGTDQDAPAAATASDQYGQSLAVGDTVTLTLYSTPRTGRVTAVHGPGHHAPGSVSVAWAADGVLPAASDDVDTRYLMRGTSAPVRELSAADVDAPASDADAVNVWETLAAGTWSGAVVKVGKGREHRSHSVDVLTLPEGRLSRDAYLAVRAVVESLGGRWSKAARGFAFLPSSTVWDGTATGTRTESGAQRLTAWLTAHGGADAMARVAEDAAADQDSTPAAPVPAASDDQDAPAGEVWRSVPRDAHTTCGGCGTATIYGDGRVTNGTVTICGQCDSDRLDGIWDARPAGVYAVTADGETVGHVRHTPPAPHAYADEPGRPRGAERCSECRRRESSPIHTRGGGDDQPTDGPAPVASDDQDTPAGDTASDTMPNGATVAPVTSTTESEAPAMATPTATIDRETLAAVLSYLAGAAPTRAAIEHTTGAVLSVDADGAVSAYASDYDQWRIARAATVTGTPVTAGRVWLPVHKVSAMLGKWRTMGDQVTLTTAPDGATLTLACGRGRMTVRTLDAADMPTVPDMPPTIGTSDARTFADVTARVSGTAGTDVVLPLLTYVRMTTDGSAFRFAATDRYRFGFGVAPREAGADMAPVLLPAAPLLSLARWISGRLGSYDTDTVTVHAADGLTGWAAFTFGAYTMIVRLGEGDYPNLDALLPDAYTAAADVTDVADLVATIDRVTTGAAKQAPVLLTLAAAAVTVECGSDDARNTETVPGITWDGTDAAAVLVNPAYLVAALKACNAGARLMFTTARKSFVVAPAAGVNVGTLVVPIRREGHADAPMGANTIHNPLKGDPIMSTPATRKSATRKSTAAAPVAPVPAAVVEPTPAADVTPAPAAPVKVPAAEQAAARAFAAFAKGDYPAARTAVAEITAAGGEGYLVAGKRPVSAILAKITDAENAAAQSDVTAPAAPAPTDTAAPVVPAASDDQDAPAADTTAADAEALDAAADAATVAVLDNTADQDAPAPTDGVRVTTSTDGGAASIGWTLAKWTDGTPGYKARRTAIRKALLSAGYRVHADGGDTGRECIITIDGGIPADAVRPIIAAVEPLMRELSAARVDA